MVKVINRRLGVCDMPWPRLTGKVLMKEVGLSVETSEMENTSGRSIRTESPVPLPIQVRLSIPALSKAT